MKLATSQAGTPSTSQAPIACFHPIELAMTGGKNHPRDRVSMHRFDQVGDRLFLDIDPRRPPRATCFPPA